VKFVDKTSTLIIQQKLIDRFGGIHGLRDEGALESAINAAENRFNYETEDIA
jgi:death on curing protein